MVCGVMIEFDSMMALNKTHGVVSQAHFGQPCFEFPINDGACYSNILMY